MRKSKSFVCSSSKHVYKSFNLLKQTQKELHRMHFERTFSKIPGPTSYAKYEARENNFSVHFLRFILACSSYSNQCKVIQKRGPIVLALQLVYFPSCPGLFLFNFAPLKRWQNGVKL